MKNILLYENFTGPMPSHSGTKIYVIMVGMEWGPDYGFKTLVVFPSNNPADARLKFMEILQMDEIAYKDLLDKYPQISDKFIEEIVEESYVVDNGWGGPSTIFFGAYTPQPGFKLGEEDELLSISNEGDTPEEIEEMQEDSLMKLTQAIGAKNAAAIFSELDV